MSEQKKERKQISNADFFLTFGAMMTLACGLGVGIATLAMPSMFPQGDALKTSLQSKCMTNLSTTTPITENAGRITIEFTRQAVDDCVKQGLDDYAMRRENDKFNGTVAFSVAALGAVFCAGVYRRNRRKYGSAPNTPAA